MGRGEARGRGGTAGLMRRLGIVFLLAAFGGIVYLLATAGMSGAVLVLVVMQAVLVAGFVVRVRSLDRRPHLHASAGVSCSSAPLARSSWVVFVYIVVAAPDRDNAAFAAAAAVQVVGFLVFFIGTVAGRRVTE